MWQRAQGGARDDDPQRIEKLARIRHTLEPLGKRAVGLFADELDIHLLPKVGYQWMPKSATVKLVTPGQNQKCYLAGALEPQSGRLVQCTGIRKTNALFRALREQLDWLSPPAQFTPVSSEELLRFQLGMSKSLRLYLWDTKPRKRNSPPRALTPDPPATPGVLVPFGPDLRPR